MSLNIVENKYLGRGCYGEVYYGTLDSRPIAGKKCFAGYGPPVYKEARFLKCCDHPNVIKSHGVFKFGGEDYLVMDFAEAGSLRDNLGRNAFSIRANKDLIRQVCDGLEHIHAQGIVHRDIKPENLLLKSIALPHVVFGDFGEAQFFSESSRKRNTHDVVSDPVYTYESDIYLLGLTTIQIFEDRRYFDRQEPLSYLTSLVSNKKIFSAAKWRRAILNSLDTNQAARPTPAEFREAFWP